MAYNIRKGAPYLLFLIMAIILVGFRWHIPAYWDENMVLVGSEWVAHHGFNPLLGGFCGGCHPPLVYEFVALAFVLLGFTIQTVKIILLGLSVLILAATYELAFSITGDKKQALVAAVLLAVSPLFVAQAGLISFDLPLTLLILLTLHSYFTNHRGRYIFVGMLMTLTKEHGALVIGIIAFSELLKSGRFAERVRRLAFYAIPLIPFIIWVGVTHYSFGYIFYPTVVGAGYAVTALYWFKNLKMIASLLLPTYNLLLIPFIIIGISLSLKENKKHQSRKASHLLVFIIITYVGFSAFFNDFTLSRYVLPLFPLFYVIVARGIFLSTEHIAMLARNIHFEIRPVLYSIITLLIISFFATNYTSNRECFGTGCGAYFETNLDYLLVAEGQRLATAFIDNEYHNHIISASWPISEFLVYPLLGHVSSPLSVVNDVAHLSEAQIIVVSDQSHDREKILDNLIQLNSSLAKCFGTKGKETCIYSNLNNPDSIPSSKEPSHKHK